MVRIKSFHRPTLNMMSSTACLLVLLAIAFPVQAVELDSDDTPPDVFPSEVEPATQLQGSITQ